MKSKHTAINKPIINITKVWAGKNELNKEDYNVKTSTGTPVLCINSRALIGMAQNKKILLGITYETGMYPNTLSVPNKIKLSIADEVLPLNDNCSILEEKYKASSSATCSWLKYNDVVYLEAGTHDVTLSVYGATGAN